MAKLTNAQLAALVTKLEKENEDLKGYLQKCSGMIEGDGLLAVKIERLVSQKSCTSCDHTPPEVPACVKCGKPNPGYKPALPGGAPTSIRVEDGKVLPTMKWLMRYVGYTGDVPTDEVLSAFEVYTNQDKSWLAVYPKKGLAGAGAFVKGLNQARHARQVTGNWWKNHGMWCNIPVKK